MGISQGCALSMGGQLSWKQSRQNQNGWMEVKQWWMMNNDAISHIKPCHIYWMMSSSKCKGSCPEAWHIFPELGWYNTVASVSWGQGHGNCDKWSTRKQGAGTPYRGGTPTPLKKHTRNKEWQAHRHGHKGSQGFNKQHASWQTRALTPRHICIHEQSQGNTCLQ